MNESSGTAYQCPHCGKSMPAQWAASHRCVSASDLSPGTGYIESIGIVHACINCGVLVAGGPTRCIQCAAMVGPKFTVEYDPAEGAPVYAKIEIRELPAGSIFETDDGTRAVKSEYKLRPNDPDSPAMCIIIGSGEFFHSDQGDGELVMWIE